MTDVQEQTLEDLDLDLNLDDEVACQGTVWWNRLFGVTQHNPCDRPAEWRCTVRCCKVKTTFHCPAHKSRLGTETVCTRCGTQPIPLEWEPLR